VRSDSGVPDLEMLRSRSSAQLLPVTTNGSFSRHDSHSKRRRTGGVAAAQR
jgi:hypothetical protein